jgi:thiamine biosynthesis lipoprotein
VTGRRTATADIMGTVISIAAPGDVEPARFGTAAKAAFAVLRRADEVFSPYKPDSPVSMIRDGRLRPADLAGHPEGPWIREVLALCATLKARSGGAFDAWAVGDPPAFDPCGAVKGWAAERAGAVLTAHGIPAHVVSAGGDVRLRGAGWQVGIADPHRPGRLVAVAQVGDGAVATSGTAERGAHVWDPRGRRPAQALAQVTVIGPSLTWADGYATAAVALGDRAAGWLTDLARRTGYESLTIDPDGGVWWTAGMPAHIPSLAQPELTRA